MIKVRNIANNQYIITDYDNERVIFQSYETTICIVDKDNCIVTVNADYKHSVTTNKYVRKFCDEIFYSDFSGLMTDAIKGIMVDENLVIDNWQVCGESDQFIDRMC